MKSFDFFSIREYFPSPENPSASTWVYNQAKHIQQFGIKPLVISPTPKVPFWINIIKKKKHAWKIKSSSQIKDYMGIDVIRPSFLKLPSKYFFEYDIKQISNCISNVAKDINPKFIHAHFGHIGVASLNLKREKKIPLITSFYVYDLGSDKSRLINHYKILSNNGDLFLALSEDMKKDLIEIGFPVDKTIVHHLGIDLTTFSPSLEQKPIQSDFVFTIVASFERRKGIHIAIQAFKLFKQRFSILNAKLHIVGDGSYNNTLRKLADNDRDIIFINNFIATNPRMLVLNEMQNCDVFMLTSITLPNFDKEGTPVVLMEAQACEKPCISSFHAGIPEVVINEETGILCKEGDIYGIADAMMALYSDPVKRESFGKQARKHISINFNKEIQMPKLEKIYKKFL